MIPIATGAHEEHIVADVAWASEHYAAWTGDTAFLAGAGRDLVVETARYWASRIRLDSAGRGHLDQLMGPDEYHQLVDDNAFTNVMARWNLRRGAEVLAQTKGNPQEAETWRALADCLVDGWDPERGLYEQFAGYFDLEPLLMTQIGPPPLAVDMVLGSERVTGSQLIKQADVLMLYHLVPDQVVPHSLATSLGFYEPRTAHGSSLSPAISAALLARAGEPERALELFRLAARLDIDDVTGTTAGGLHLATMGGVWQALAYGFLGLRAQDDFLSIDPSLPEEWSALELRLRFHGRRVTVRAEHDSVAVRCDGSIRVRLGDHETVSLRRSGAHVRDYWPHPSKEEAAMSIVLVALDASPTAQSVLDTALRIAALTTTDVEAIHVTTAHDEAVKARTDRAHVSLHLLPGPLEPALLSAVEAPHVIAAVIGTKAMANDRRLLETTARHIIEHCTKPVVIVPPDFVPPGFIRRLLIPLEGTEASTQPVLEVLLPLLAVDVELIVIHVFTESTAPAMLDHPWRDLEILGKEFLSRHLPQQEASIEFRHGHVGTQVAEVCHEYGADLIVLSWSQDSTAGRARIAFVR